MGAENNLSFLGNQIFDGLESFINALGVADVSFGIEGNVKITADKNFLASHVDIFDGLLVEVIHAQHSFKFVFDYTLY